MNLPLTNMNSSDNQQTVCVFGTGDFGRSLGNKLLQCGYSVVFGSRNLQGLYQKGVEVLSYEEAAKRSDLIIVAVHREHYNFLADLAEQLQGKILVDISNNIKINQYPQSNAEYLAELVPGAKIVKAFNTVSAWALQSGHMDANRQVFVCGNDKESKQRVMVIGRDLGLTPLDQGCLMAAKKIENYPLKLFPMWKFPLYLAAALCIFLLVYCVFRDILYFYIYEKKDTSFGLAISIPNRIFPVVSLNLLALVYLPGIIAATLQLYRGTKYSCFPNWLDHWMLCRKHVGLLAFAFAFLHVMYTLVIPIRYFVRWKASNSIIKQVTTNTTVPFDTSTAWIKDSYISLGILAFFFFILLGITSLPSVSNMVNWREFQFVQSKLGYLTLILSTAHTLVFGGKKFLNPAVLRWNLPAIHVIGLIIPCVVLVLKFILVMPCFDWPLTRIRQGWERKPKALPKAHSENGFTEV